jgi:hypothetical protein
MSDDERVEIQRDASGRAKGDETPPRNEIIFAAAVMTVITLFSLKYVFDSYLDASNLRVRREHISESHASEVLAEYRRHSEDQLREGQMPIGDAMEQLATRGRAAFPVIRPVPDTNTGAREGWAAMPVVAGEPAPRAQPTEEPELIDGPAPEAVPPTSPEPGQTDEGDLPL